MSTNKYVAAIWADYAKRGDGFKILSCAKLYDYKPTKMEALEDFGEDDEHYTKDILINARDVDCWLSRDDYAELGDPVYYMLTISTEAQTEKLLDSISRSMREKIK